MKNDECRMQNEEKQARGKGFLISPILHSAFIILHWLRILHFLSFYILNS